MPVLGSFDDLVAGLDLPEDQKKALLDASRVRAEAKEAEERAAAATAENAALREAVLKDRWKAIGAVGDPTNLRLPDDVKVTDEDALREFADKGGFLVKKPDAPAGDLDAYQRISSASTGAGSAEPGDAMSRILAETDPSKGLNVDQFFEKVASFGLLSNKLPAQ